VGGLVSSPTGHMSDPRPNLQNIPIRTEEGTRIRKFFKPEVTPIPTVEEWEEATDPWSDIERMFGFRCRRSAPEEHGPREEAFAPEPAE
jgi:hypothetical protein